jgi:hypothetical protein
MPTMPPIPVTANLAAAGVLGQPADDVLDFLDLGGVLRFGRELVFDDVGENSSALGADRPVRSE